VRSSDARFQNLLRRMNLQLNVVLKRLTVRLAVAAQSKKATKGGTQSLLYHGSNFVVCNSANS